MALIAGHNFARKITKKNPYTQVYGHNSYFFLNFALIFTPFWKIKWLFIYVG